MHSRMFGVGYCDMKLVGYSNSEDGEKKPASSIA